MKICVLIKQVPDKNSPLTIASDHLSLLDSNITWISNESDIYALEEALLLKETHGGEVVVCTLGPDSSSRVIKDALSKGADRGIFIRDDVFNNLDILSLAKVFASAFKDEKFDLILTGLQSDDYGNSQLGLLLAELLNMSHASLVMGTEIQNDTSIKVKRELESGWFQWTKLDLPASLTIQSGINTPRYASLQGIMKMKNKPIDELTENDIKTGGLMPKVKLNNIFIPEKAKETTYLDGSPDEISQKLVDLFKNEIKVLN